VRIVSFGGSMLAMAIACWATFLTYHSIGTNYFRHQDFWSTFTGIEQVPGTSIYTSRNPMAQLASFIETMHKQADVLLRIAATVFVFRVLRRVLADAPMTPAERRLAIGTATNFAAIASFFLINNTHNGFI